MTCFLRRVEAGCGEESWGEGAPGGSCDGAGVVTKCLIGIGVICGPVFDVIIHLLESGRLESFLVSFHALRTVLLHFLHSRAL